jgi:hypothetical protein
MRQCITKHVSRDHIRPGCNTHILAADSGWSCRKEKISHILDLSQEYKIVCQILHSNNDFLRCRSSENCRSFLTDEGKDECFVNCFAEYIELSSKTEEQPFCSARKERKGNI